MSIGHNSGEVVISKKTKAGPISADRLKSFIERIEKLEEERQAIGGDIRDVYAEAKDVGYDVKTMRKLVAERKMDAADRDEQETLLDVYRHALGMAVAEVAGGATIRAAAEKHGVSKSTLHRAVPKTETAKPGTVGEILEAQPTANAVVRKDGTAVGHFKTPLDAQPAPPAAAPETPVIGNDDLPDFTMGDVSQPMTAGEIKALEDKQAARVAAAHGPLAEEDDLTIPRFLQGSSKKHELT